MSNLYPGPIPQKTNMRTLVVILARGASTRVPQKNIQVVGGKPILHYTLDYVNRCKYPVDYFVMTESTDVAQVAQSYNQFGATVRFERDTSNAPVCRKIEQTVCYHEEDTCLEYQLIIGLNADCPIRPEGLIEKIIDEHRETLCDSTETVVKVPITYHPCRMRIIRRVGDCYPFITSNIDHEEYSQFYQPVYAVVGAAFSCSRSHLRRAGWMGNRHLGIHLRPIVIPSESFMEIDTPEDMDAFRKFVECKNP